MSDPTLVNVRIREAQSPAPEPITIDVEFRPHVGTMQTRFGAVSVTHPQMIVMAGPADGKLTQVAFVGTHPGAPINFITANLPEPIKEAVRVAVADRMGDGERKEAQPPAPRDPEEDIDTDVVNDDEDDDDLDN